MHLLYECHLELLESAQRACRTREAFVPFQESPGAKHHPDGAQEHGRAQFERRLNQALEISDHPGEVMIGEEVSPYTMQRLNVSYPVATVEELFDATTAGAAAWARTDPATRVGICLEALVRLSTASFENAFATMHTSGQAFMMAFAGSGANSLDRGLEGIAFADLAMRQVPESSLYQRAFGRGEEVTLQKRYRLRPRGVALVITCGSYPAWNAYPALFANLATGNPVILKPHPLGLLPMALAVDTVRHVLAEQGFDPNLVVLGVDRLDAPIAGALHADPRTAIVDFTGGQRFGRWLEQNAGDRLVYTETSGVNHVLLESVRELDPVLRAVAQGVAIFSGQMCTAPQNFLVPRHGVATDDGIVSFDEVVDRFTSIVDELAANHAVASALCGAVQQSSTIDGVHEIADHGGLDVVRAASPYTHPEHPDARTLTPLVAVCDPGVVDREVFGPVAAFSQLADGADMLRHAAVTCRHAGSIANYVYSVDDHFVAAAEDAFADAGASVGINLIRQRPINFTAAFSDYHVTGLNPAGNASLTDMAFVASRFRIVQSKRELS